MTALAYQLWRQRRAVPKRQLWLGAVTIVLVPLIVIGDDEVVLKGFDEKRFEEAVTKVGKK